jgi:4-hydroxybenzoate polyprenyltransferase
VTRAGEWWEHKLAPVAATGYASAWLLHASIAETWLPIATVVAALAVCAAYVCVVNDLTDLEADRAAGKHNRLAGRSPVLAPVAIGACLVAGAGIALLAWRDDPLALAVYAASWIAFSAYSIAPLRLKARGAAGALADAIGAVLAPQLLVAIVVFGALDAPIDGWWLGCVGAWALALGLRGAIWHQLTDVGADARSDLATFARGSPDRVRGTTMVLLFAVELAAFAGLLVLAGNRLAFALLPVYVLLERMRMRLWGVRLVVTAPAPDYRIAMHEYYVVLYPLAFLLALATRDFAALALLVAHVALFPRTAGRLALDGTRALRHMYPSGLIARR